MQLKLFWCWKPKQMTLWWPCGLKIECKHEGGLCIKSLTWKAKYSWCNISIATGPVAFWQLASWCSAQCDGSWTYQSKGAHQHKPQTEKKEDAGISNKHLQTATYILLSTMRRYFQESRSFPMNYQQVFFLMISIVTSLVWSWFCLHFRGFSVVCRNA